MNLLIPIFSEPWMQRLGWALLHFIWQGTAIALLLAVVLRLFPRATSHIRYLIIASALFLCGTMPVINWIALGSSSAPYLQPVIPAAPSTAPNPEISTAASENPHLYSTAQPPAEAWPERAYQAANTALPYAVSLWFAGVLILTFRLTLDWTGLQRLRRSGRPIQDQGSLEKFRSLLARMQISLPVRLLESALVEVPTLIGWLRPTILIPASVLVGLTPDQLAAILAHELAHVRRHDYLVNLLQTVIETILFYHPAVWWISRQLRAERENCCDDLALEVMQDRLVYVSALAQLEERRATPFALSASAGPLLQRIKRLAGASDRKASAWPLCILFLGIFSLIYLANVNLKADRNVSSADSADLQSRLKTAVQKGDAATAQKLIAQGANPKAIDNIGETLLFRSGSPEIAELLIKNGVSPLTRDKFDITALSSLCLNGNENTAPIVRVLLRHGADPNCRNGELKTTPLMGLCNGATVDVLVQYGADVRAHDSSGDSVLYWATWQELSAFEALIRHGAPFDVRTDGPSLLLLAVQNVNLPVEKWLLDHGVDPNLTGSFPKGDEVRSTPMQLAVCGGRAVQFSGTDDEEAMVKLLLAHGARVTNEMVLALNYNRPVLVKLFWDRGRRDISALSYRISQGASTNEVQKLLDQGTPVNPPQDRQITPLNVAAGMGRMALVQLLIQRGADVNKAEPLRPKFPRSRTTPLTTAASLGEDDIVEYLLQHGAQPDLEAMAGAVVNSFFSPLWFGSPKEKFERSVALLIDAGTLKNVSLEEGGKLLEDVIMTRDQGGNPIILKMLLDAGLNPESPLPGRNGEKKMPTLAYCQDLYNHPNDRRWTNKLKVTIALLEKAEATVPR